MNLGRVRMIYKLFLNPKHAHRPIVYLAYKLMFLFSKSPNKEYLKQKMEEEDAKIPKEDISKGR